MLHFSLSLILSFPFFLLWLSFSFEHRFFCLSYRHARNSLTDLSQPTFTNIETDLPMLGQVSIPEKNSCGQRFRCTWYKYICSYVARGCTQSFHSSLSSYPCNILMFSLRNSPTPPFRDFYGYSILQAKLIRSLAIDDYFNLQPLFPLQK